MEKERNDDERTKSSRMKKTIYYLLYNLFMSACKNTKVPISERCD